MEPCLFRHGKLNFARTENVPPSLQWSHVFSDMVRWTPLYNYLRTDSASMEPCLFRHGKSFIISPFETPGGLQWSHVFSDMVSSAVGKSIAEEIRASMEPCLFRHGKLLRTRNLPGFCHASMEPCLFRHGKAALPLSHRGSLTSFNGAMSFQTW